MQHMARVVVAALVLALAAAAPAGATFPGRNGNLLVTYDNGQYKYFSQRFTLWKIAPRTGRVRWILICGASALIQDVASRCRNAGPPAASPDGETAAVMVRDQPERPEDPANRWSIRLISLETGLQTRVALAPSDRLFLPLSTPALRWWQGGDGFVVLRALAPWDGKTRLSDWEPGQALLVASDGSAATELTTSAAAPDVAADGRLAFVRDRNVHIRDASGTVRPLTRGGGFHPSWSPGGRFIAFSRRGHVFVVRSSGGKPRRLARGTDPVWSPDGTQIAFFRRALSGEEWTYLYVLSRRTGRVRRVSDQVFDFHDDWGTGASAGLDWQPLPAAP
jgi:hypothetical protein